MKKRVGKRRGAALVYIIVILPVLVGVSSLAVDFGYVEYNKFQLQQISDCVAHDYMVLYEKYGSQTVANAQISTNKNSIFSVNGKTPTITATWGYWNAYTQTFSTTTSSGASIAIKVVASCKRANSNAVALLFGTIIGQASIDMSASSVATDVGVSSSVNISATSNLYLSGMPSTTTTVWGDNGIANAPTQVVGIPVVPGTYLTFSSFTGTTSVIPGSMPYYGPGGSTGTYGTAIQHGQNWDGPQYSATTENGIGNAIMPESSLVGLFLDSNQPDSTAAPSTTVDWTQSSVKNQNTFTNLSLKAPFYIGDGKNGTTTQTFQVPAGATRLYLAIWDGVEYNNNDGSLSGTVTVKHQIVIVQ